ncbi:hypothetical protein ATW98_09765 [Oenococcus oeni]|nr:hypothetical protein ATW98_09765 [Oenococcus oeni]
MPGMGMIHPFHMHGTEFLVLSRNGKKLTVDKRKLQLPQPIKTIGLHEVPAKLHTQVSAMIKVNVSELN